MHEGEQHRAYGGQPGPPVADKQIMKLSKAVKFHQVPRGKIRHDDDRNNDFVCREPQDKRHQNNAVKSQQFSEGV